MLVSLRGAAAVRAGAAAGWLEAAAATCLCKSSGHRWRVLQGAPAECGCRLLPAVLLFGAYAGIVVFLIYCMCTCVGVYIYIYRYLGVYI